MKLKNQLENPEEKHTKKYNQSKKHKLSQDSLELSLKSDYEDIFDCDEKDEDFNIGRIRNNKIKDKKIESKIKSEISRDQAELNRKQSDKKQLQTRQKQKDQIVNEKIDKSERKRDIKQQIKTENKERRSERKNQQKHNERNSLSKKSHKNYNRDLSQSDDTSSFDGNKPLTNRELQNAMIQKSKRNSSQNNANKKESKQNDRKLRNSKQDLDVEEELENLLQSEFQNQSKKERNSKQNKSTSCQKQARLSFEDKNTTQEQPQTIKKQIKNEVINEEKVQDEKLLNKRKRESNDKKEGPVVQVKFKTSHVQEENKSIVENQQLEEKHQKEPNQTIQPKVQFVINKTMQSEITETQSPQNQIEKTSKKSSLSQIKKLNNHDPDLSELANLISLDKQNQANTKQEQAFSQQPKSILKKAQNLPLGICDPCLEEKIELFYQAKQNGKVFEIQRDKKAHQSYTSRLRNYEHTFKKYCQQHCLINPDDYYDPDYTKIQDNQNENVQLNDQNQDISSKEVKLNSQGEKSQSQGESQDQEQKLEIKEKSQRLKSKHQSTKIEKVFNSAYEYSNYAWDIRRQLRSDSQRSLRDKLYNQKINKEKYKNEGMNHLLYCDHQFLKMRQPVELRFVEYMNDINKTEEEKKEESKSSLIANIEQKSVQLEETKAEVIMTKDNTLEVKDTTEQKIAVAPEQNQVFHQQLYQMMQTYMQNEYEKKQKENIIQSEVSKLDNKVQNETIKSNLNLSNQEFAIPQVTLDHLKPKIQLLPESKLNPTASNTINQNQCKICQKFYPDKRYVKSRQQCKNCSYGSGKKKLSNQEINQSGVLSTLEQASSFQIDRSEASASYRHEFSGLNLSRNFQQQQQPMFQDSGSKNLQYLESSIIKDSFSRPINSGMIGGTTNMPQQSISQIQLQPQITHQFKSPQVQNPQQINTQYPISNQQPQISISNQQPHYYTNVNNPVSNNQDQLIHNHQMKSQLQQQNIQQIQNQNQASVQQNKETSFAQKLINNQIQYNLQQQKAAANFTRSSSATHIKPSLNLHPKFEPFQIQQRISSNNKDQEKPLETHNIISKTEKNNTSDEKVDNRKKNIKKSQSSEQKRNIKLPLSCNQNSRTQIVNNPFNNEQSRHIGLLQNQQNQTASLHQEPLKIQTNQVKQFHKFEPMSPMNRKSLLQNQLGQLTKNQPLLTLSQGSDCFSMPIFRAPAPVKSPVQPKINQNPVLIQQPQPIPQFNSYNPYQNPTRQPPPMQNQIIQNQQNTPQIVYRQQPQIMVRPLMQQFQHQNQIYQPQQISQQQMVYQQQQQPYNNGIYSYHNQQQQQQIYQQYMMANQNQQQQRPPNYNNNLFIQRY